MHSLSTTRTETKKEEVSANLHNHVKKKQPAEKIECLQEDVTHRIEQPTIHGYMEFRLNLNSHYKVHTG